MVMALCEMLIAQLQLARLSLQLTYNSINQLNRQRTDLMRSEWTGEEEGDPFGLLPFMWNRSPVQFNMPFAGYWKLSDSNSILNSCLSAARYRRRLRDFIFFS